jgi:transcription elongation factor GreA
VGSLRLFGARSGTWHPCGELTLGLKYRRPHPGGSRATLGTAIDHMLKPWITVRIPSRTSAPAVRVLPNFHQNEHESPIAMDKVPMTVQGYRALDEDLKRLKTIERPAVTVAIGEARLHGDLKENAEYHAAKDRQGWIEGQIVQIGDMIARAQVIDVTKLSGTQIKFGATVSVIDQDTEDQARYQIVGEHEADVKKGRISITSPIARAMIGKESGDVVEVRTPGGLKAYEITKVEWV